MAKWSVVKRTPKYTLITIDEIGCQLKKTKQIKYFNSLRLKSTNNGKTWKVKTVKGHAKIKILNKIS